MEISDKLHASSVLPWGKRHQVGTSDGLEVLGEDKILVPLPGIEPRFIRRLVLDLVTMPTELSGIAKEGNTEMSLHLQDRLTFDLCLFFPHTTWSQSDVSAYWKLYS
jgi:hypothetical protein